MNTIRPLTILSGYVRDFESQQLRVELNGDIDVSHDQHGMSHFADLERQISRRLNPFQCLYFGIVQPVQVDLAHVNPASFHCRSLPV
jgi:hypothetical protein